jgi:hypothetical protein
MARALVSIVPLLALFLALPVAQAKEEQTRTQIDLPAREPVVLRFLAFDPSRVLIDEQALLKELVKILQGLSKRPLKTQGNLVRHQSGLRAKLDAAQSRIDFEYLNLDLYDSGSQYGESLTISGTYEVTRGDRDLAIHLSLPRTGELLTRSSRGLFRVSSPKLDPAAELIQDFYALLDAATHLTVHRHCDVKGEKTSPYKPEAVIGNFDRLLGRHGSSSNETVAALDRPDVFAYLAGRVRVPLSVTAISYRDGAKVIYSTSLPYTLRADGTGEGYDLPDRLSADVDRILSD